MRHHLSDVQSYADPRLSDVIEAAIRDFDCLTDQVDNMPSADCIDTLESNWRDDLQTVRNEVDALGERLDKLEETMDSIEALLREITASKS